MVPTMPHEYFEALPFGVGENRLQHSTCEVIDLVVVGIEAGGTHDCETGDNECILVVLTGTVDVAVDGRTWTGLGGRTTVFDGPPTAVYLPRDTTITITASTAAEVALGLASSDAAPIAPYLVEPAEVATGQWGEGPTERHFSLIIDAERPSERLFAAEVTVADGRWATYPPHKHEVDAADGSELFQEELYYYRVDPAPGIGLCALYGGRTDGDTAFVVRDRTVHKMPYGYHTVTAAPGYRVWYLAIYAGHAKAAQPFVDPEHRWYLTR